MISVKNVPLCSRLVPKLVNPFLRGQLYLNVDICKFKKNVPNKYEIISLEWSNSARKLVGRILCKHTCCKHILSMTNTMTMAMTNLNILLVLVLLIIGDKILIVTCLVLFTCKELLDDRLQLRTEIFAMEPALKENLCAAVNEIP